VTARDLSEVRFFVDETSLGLGKSLEAARKDVVHPGHWLLPDIPTGTTDPVWIPAVAKLGLIVIGRDKHIRTRPAEIEVLRAGGLRVFRLASKRDLTTWGYLVRLVNRWNEMERVIRDRGPGPWFYAVLDAGLSEIRV
jgi:hypothetical protein